MNRFNLRLTEIREFTSLRLFVSIQIKFIKQ